MKQSEQEGEEMKKLVVLLVSAAFLAFPLFANAGIIGDVNLTEIFSSPTGSVSFPRPVSGTYYLDYDAKINSGPQIEAFCVEDADGPSGTLRYTLLSIDSGLSAFGLDATNYMAAAWIAQTYVTADPMSTSAQEAVKAAAQIAVWEVIFDGIGNLNLGAGGFRSSDYVAQANAILAALPSSFSASTQWTLAVNPTVGTAITEGAYAQNYIVHHPVPIPAAVWLLGSGLLGLVGIRRRRTQE